MLTQKQKEQIAQLKQITQRTDLLIVSILMYFQWDLDKSMDFIINAGDFLSEDLIPIGRRQGAESLLKEEKEAEEAQKKIQQQISNQQQNKKQSISEQKQSNQQQILEGDKKIKKDKQIEQIREMLQQIENLQWEDNEIIQQEELIKNNISWQKELQRNNLQQQSANNDLQFRTHKSFLGIKNCDESCVFNCVYQLLFQIPEFVQLVFNANNYNKEDQNNNFLNELKYLFISLILSNESYVRDSNLYVAVSRINKQVNNVNNEPLNFAICFENHIKNLISLFQDNLRQNNIFENIFQSFFNHKQLFFSFEQDDRLLYLSLLKQIDCFKQLGPQQNLKSYWTFEIIRNKARKQDYSSSQKNVDYWFPLILDLDFLNYKDKEDDMLQFLETKTKDEVIKDIKKQLSNFNALETTISTLGEQDIIQIETLEELKILKEEIEMQLSKQVPFCLVSSQSDLKISRFSLHLGATVIELKEENYHFFYLYIYNFFQNQWYRVNDCQVQVVTESMVLKDTRKNGCFLLYVEHEQTTKQNDYQSKLDEIAYKILKNQEDQIKELSQNNVLLQNFEKQNPRLFEKILNSNKANENKLNEELNNEFNL